MSLTPESKPRDDAGAPPAGRHVSHPTYRASATVAEGLQSVLADLIELHVQGKQAHWNVVGHNFRDLHLQLDEVVDAARVFADEVAERMRAVMVTPDGRTSVVAETTRVAPFPAGEINSAECIDRIVSALYQVSATIRAIHDEVDAEDPTTTDLLHAITARVEQLAWMMDAENRVAHASEPQPYNA
jgi:starvation-inducible DNA-binding protein